MALQLISANRVESLLEELARRLVSPRLASVFDTETIVVPGPAMGHWVRLQLAARHGVAANQHFPLPASWIWELTARVLDGIPARDPLERNAAGWHIHALLPDLLDLPAFGSLRHYLNDDSDGLKRWQLSARIADVFDRYQFYRPDLVRHWSRDESEREWQAVLWRRLTAPHQRTHRVAVLDRLLKRLHQDDPPGGLPQRASLFALSTLPPLFVDVLHALARHTQITLYLHSPTDQYWADLRSKKDLSRLRVESRDEAAYYDTGNELLASWGRQGQAMQDLLLGNDDLQAAEWEDYRPPAAASLLGRIQKDIFELEHRPAPAGADDTLQIHVCHSALRECQVLHDQLLHMLERDASLRPEDILVMVPEISRYAPYIEAVFRREENGSRPFIPWNLSDTSVTDEHPLLRIFFQLLDLPGSRFAVSDVLSCLDVPEITARFDLDETACEQVRLLLDRARVRWGLDEQHKRSLGLPPEDSNSWKQAEQRLFAGYALGEAGFWEGIAPLGETEGSMADSAGRFWALFDRMREYRGRLDRPRSAQEWQRLLNHMLEDFFRDTADDDGRLQQIRDTLDELAAQARGQTLSLRLVRYWLESELGTRTVNAHWFSGGVTFCGMRPMRSLPFRVICLVGMNDQAFPRRDRPAEFDHMANRWRPGDPRKGDEDRYLLLETLLCTRQTLYISYTGRNMQDNSERQPSVLVRELLDFVDEHYSAEASSDRPLSRQLTRIHPLQAFSPRNYCKPPRSHDRYWCEVARSAARPARRPSPAPWPDTPIEAAAEELTDIDMGRLTRFAVHPVRFFVNHSLGIYLTEEVQDEDEEPFSLDGLQRWQLGQRLIDGVLDGRPVEREQLKALGLLPHGALARVGFEEARRLAEPVLDAVRDYAAIRPRPRLVDVTLDDGIRLGGQIGRYWPGRGLLHWSPSAFKGTALLALWLEHLGLCACGQLGANESSRLVCSDSHLQLPPLSAREARERMQPWGGFYREGLRRPLPVLPKASHAWAAAAGDKRRQAAMAQWRASDYGAGRSDSEDAYIGLVVRGIEASPVDYPEFGELAEAFYRDALAHAEPL